MSRYYPVILSTVHLVVGLWGIGSDNSASELQASAVAMPDTQPPPRPNHHYIQYSDYHE